MEGAWQGRTLLAVMIFLYKQRTSGRASDQHILIHSGDKTILALQFLHKAFYFTID